MCFRSCKIICTFNYLQASLYGFQAVRFFVSYPENGEITEMLSTQNLNEHVGI